MRIKKLKKLEGIYFNRQNIDFNCGMYTLHVVSFPTTIRVFLQGEFLVYEVTDKDCIISEVVGLLSWLESKHITASLSIYKEIELVQLAWYDKLPKIVFN